MNTFNTPQLLRRYEDGSLRIVTHQPIVAGDDIVFRNEKWEDEKRRVDSILEQRPSFGDFGGNKIPTSYKIQF